MAESDDLEDVMKEETARGRRPVDTTALKHQARIRAELLKAVREKDERSFMKWLREAGVMDGTPQFAEAVRIFHEKCGQK